MIVITSLICACVSSLAALLYVFFKKTLMKTLVAISILSNIIAITLSVAKERDNQKRDAEIQQMAEDRILHGVELFLYNLVPKGKYDDISNDSLFQILRSSTAINCIQDIRLVKRQQDGLPVSNSYALFEERFNEPYLLFQSNAVKGEALIEDAVKNYATTLDGEVVRNAEDILNSRFLPAFKLQNIDAFLDRCRKEEDLIDSTYDATVTGIPFSDSSSRYCLLGYYYFDAFSSDMEYLSFIEKIQTLVNSINSNHKDSYQLFASGEAGRI